jgi:hypothetical protein
VQHLLAPPKSDPSALDFFGSYEEEDHPEQELEQQSDPIGQAPKEEALPEGEDHEM